MLVLTILGTPAVPALRTLVAALPLDIQAATAIQAVTLLQGALVVLETILLVPLVTIRNQATEGCKRRVVRKWRTTVVTCACLSHPGIAYSRLCITQHLLSVTQRPSATCGFLVSWLNPPLLSHPLQLHYI